MSENEITGTCGWCGELVSGQQVPIAGSRALMLVAWRRAHWLNKAAKISDRFGAREEQELKAA
jgi:hypothetical protein